MRAPGAGWARAAAHAGPAGAPVPRQRACAQGTCSAPAQPLGTKSSEPAVASGAGGAGVFVSNHSPVSLPPSHGGNSHATLSALRRTDASLAAAGEAQRPENTCVTRRLEPLGRGDPAKETPPLYLHSRSRLPHPVRADGGG